MSRKFINIASRLKVPNNNQVLQVPQHSKNYSVFQTIHLESPPLGTKLVATEGTNKQQTCNFPKIAMKVGMRTSEQGMRSWRVSKMMS